MKIKLGISTALATALVTSIGTLGVSGTAVAQVLEEVVVTARRYEESITDAPLSVGVFTDDYMRAQGVQGTDGLLELTPGASWNQFTKAQPGATLRGVSAGSFGNSSLESSIPTVIDGIPVSKVYMSLPPVFDLERAEVMRGPQGTTFGRNASVGLMHLITAKPSQEFASGVNLSVGDRDRFDVDAFINGALTDTVSGRLAFNYDDQDGNMEDLITGAPLDGLSNIALRGSLLIEPNDNFSAYLKAEFSQDDDGPPIRRGGSCEAPIITSPPYTTTGEFTEDCDVFKTLMTPGFDFFLERDVLTLAAELTWAVGEDKTLTWLSGYMDGDHDNFQDAFGTPAPILNQRVTNNGDMFTQEVRLDNSAAGGNFRWLVGAFYLEDEEHRLEDNWSWPNGGGRNFSDSHLVTDSLGNTESVAVFGELSFDLTDRLNLTVGGRQTEDSKDYAFEVRAWGRAGDLPRVTGCPENTFPQPPGVGGGPLCGTPDNPVGFTGFESDSWDNFSGKVSLSYVVNDNSNVYALYSEGFKAGGFQHDARNQAQLDLPIGNEEVTNFELGWKGSYDRARFAVTLFDMQNEGTQVNALIAVGNTGAFTTVISNAGGVDTQGVEFDGTFLLTDNFILGGTLAVFDGALTDTIISAAVNPITGEVEGEDVSGQRPNNVPDQTYSLYGEYDINLNSGSIITLRADVRNRSDVWRRLPNRDDLCQCSAQTPEFLSPEFTQYGVRLSWTSAEGGTSLSLWGRNLGDDFDYKNIGPRTGRTNQLQGTRGVAGREDYGVDFSMRF